MGFTNINVNHIWGLWPCFRFYSFHLIFLDRTDFRFEIYVNFLRQIKLSLCKISMTRFFGWVLPIYDENHIDIKLVFTDWLSFLQLPFDFLDRNDFRFEIYVI